MSSVLDRVANPSDLKRLSLDELTRLAGEVRGLILETVSRTGGHLAASLGTVELTIALLRVFDPPRDFLVWDVGHQTYAYKILTGRREAFRHLRQWGGPSGFLRRCESPYDVFGAGHSGTALSAALGMAVARDRRGGAEHVVAILGDGALGCGVSLEGLNHVAGTTHRFIVVLNDNEMSISHNVGALSRYLGRLLANPRYNRWKRSVESVATRLCLGRLRHVYYRVEEAIKSLFLRNVMFEEMGLRYVGPIDGHHIPKLIDALEVARESPAPIVLHVATVKGKGYAPAEQEPERWHSTGPFDLESGRPPPVSTPTYSEVFGSVLEQLAEADARVVAITAAMTRGTGLSQFARRFPNQFFDVGISEEHAAVFAAGLAVAGFRPVFAVYSTFAQRIVDFLLHDICLQALPVVFCLDRAGIVGEDGPTHHGLFDIALLRPAPGLVFMQPRDEAELARMLVTAVQSGRPAVLRYPRGTGPGTPVPSSLVPLKLGEAEVLRKGEEVAIWALGDMVPRALALAELLDGRGVTTAVVNARFIKPLDTDLLVRQAVAARLVVTLENGVVAGGFGSAVQETLAAKGIQVPVLPFGWPDAFIPHGRSEELLDRYGFRPETMADAVLEYLRDRPTGHELTGTVGCGAGAPGTGRKS